MPKITKRLIDAIEPSAERIIVWDSEIKGFGMIALPSGLRSFFVQYRNESGRKRRLTLGRFGVMTAEGARKAARDALATVGRGVDPVEDRQALRAAPSVSQLLDRYLAEHVDVHNASRTADGVRFAIKRHILPRLGTLRAAAVTRQDVLKLHGAMQATPRHANLTLSILSKAFNLAETLGNSTRKLQSLSPGAALSGIPSRALPFRRRARASRACSARGGVSRAAVAREGGCEREASG